MFKGEKGITLVALVVTIVVLLILAGVSISLVIGQNGMIQKAKDTQDAQNKAYARDVVETALKTVEIDVLSGTKASGTVSDVIAAMSTEAKTKFTKATETTITYKPDASASKSYTVTVDLRTYTVTSVN